MTWRGEPDGITGTSNVTYVCPPDAYQHEPNAPAHRHHDRCQRIEPFVDEEPAAAQIARLKAENAELVKAVEKLCLVASREAAISDEEWREIVAQARKALAKAKEAR